MASRLEDRLKTALDETRLLIQGAQVLFGFQFQGVFQELFAQLPGYVKSVQCVSLLLLMISVGGLIAPSMYHQIACRGETNRTAVDAASRFACAALLPLTLGLGASAFVVFDHLFGVAAGSAVGAGFAVVGCLLFYGLGLLMRRSGESKMPENEAETPLQTKVEQLLTEARLMIPGGQALLGFQLVATLTRAFQELPEPWQYIHAAGLCAVALAVMLLMTPAALHRIAYQGEDSAQFFRIGSALVVAAALPLAAGISADVAIVFYKISGSDAEATAAGLAAGAILLATWYAYPTWRRAAARREARASPQRRTG